MPVQLAAGETKRLDVSLPPIPRLAALYGKATCQNRPVSNVDVRLDGYYVVTDINGFYQITDIQPGSCIAQFSAWRYETKEIPVTLSPDQTKELNVTLVISTTEGRPTGYILDARTGTPIPYASISVDGVYDSSSASNGGFLTSYYPFGLHTITITADNYQTADFEVDIEEFFIRINFELQPLGGLPGWPADVEVTDVIVPSVVILGDAVRIKVRLLIPYPIPLPYNGQGTIYIDGETMTSTWRASDRIPDIVFEYTPTRTGIHTVRAKDKSTTFEVIALPRAQIQGIVTAAQTGEAIANAALYIDGVLATSTDSSGNFKTGFLTPGLHKVTIISPSYKTGYFEVDLIQGLQTINFTLYPAIEPVYELLTPEPVWDLVDWDPSNPLVNNTMEITNVEVLGIRSGEPVVPSWWVMDIRVTYNHSCPFKIPRHEHGILWPFIVTLADYEKLIAGQPYTSVELISAGTMFRGYAGEGIEKKWTGDINFGHVWSWDIPVDHWTRYWAAPLDLGDYIVLLRLCFTVPPAIQERYDMKYTTRYLFPLIHVTITSQP